MRHEALGSQRLEVYYGIVQVVNSGLENIHYGERIQKGPDSQANSPDTCRRKGYPERKSSRIPAYIWTGP